MKPLALFADETSSTPPPSVALFSGKMFSRPWQGQCTKDQVPTEIAISAYCSSVHSLLTVIQISVAHCSLLENRIHVFVSILVVNTR